MRSRTSFFNKTLFWKSVTRFWPVWAFHFAIWFMALPLGVGPGRYNTANSGSLMTLQRDVLQTSIYGGLILGAVFAVLSVMAVWSFLYSARSVSGTASLPVRREGVFFSVSLAGLLPLLLSTALAFLCYYVSELTQGFGTPETLLRGFLIAALMLVFFYGFALLCAQLTGNILVLPAVYAVLNFTFAVVELLRSEVFSLFVYGYGGAYSGLYSGTLTVLSPAVQMVRDVRVKNQLAANAEDVYEVVGYVLTGWGTLIAYAVAGLVLAVLALLLYKRRRMESAGDVVAVKVLKPIFKYCMTFGCALVIGLLLLYVTGQLSVRTGTASLLVKLMGCMLLGAFIGYFAACMLMEKSFRVFKGKGRWLGFGVSALAILALMIGMECDVTGYERRVPEARVVESVLIQTSGESVYLSESENIAAALALHESIIENKNWHEQSGFAANGGEVLRLATYDEDTDTVNHWQYVYIRYTLTTDQALTRQYSLRYVADQPSTYRDALALQTLLNSDEAIRERKATEIPFTKETIIDGNIGLTLYSDEAEALYDRLESSAFYSGDSYVDYMDVPAGERYQGWVNLRLTAEECEELYETCILPDIADGTLGRVWLITDEDYRRTVYDASISIEARVPVRQELGRDGIPAKDYSYASFYTVPTVDSWRTNGWLAEHGIPLHSYAELYED